MAKSAVVGCVGCVFVYCVCVLCGGRIGMFSPFSNMLDRGFVHINKESNLFLDLDLDALRPITRAAVLGRRFIGFVFCFFVHVRRLHATSDAR